MSLNKAPFDEFDPIMYGMVTNLDGLTTGTAAQPGWSPEKACKPQLHPDFQGKKLWVYGFVLQSVGGEPPPTGETLPTL